MALRDLGDSIFDMTQIGLLVGKKIYSRSIADERDIDPAAVPELVAGLHQERVPALVAEIIQETPTTKTFRLVPAGMPLFPFRPGQFITVFLTVDGVRTSRAYSISSPPTRIGSVDITVRRVPDGFVSAYLIDEVVEGDEFEISGPGGFFYTEPLIDTNDLVFLAGGSGVTPFMSMIRTAVDLRSNVRINMIYGSRTVDDVIFLDELTRIGLEYDNINVALVLSEPPDNYDGVCGLLDAHTLDPLIGSIEGKTFFVCGPQAMYGLCDESLLTLGVPARSIKKEAAGPPPDITMVEGWPREILSDEVFTVKIADSRQRIQVAAGEPLLNSLERNGIALDNLCRSGECGVCRAGLLTGRVFMPAGVAVRKTDLAHGYIHPCMSYPISDVTIRL